MQKRTRKPAVKPDLYRQWLRRFEEDGESPPQIAKNDGYDVRTVRKHIELAWQEREMREARSMVLRQALERHYADLVALAGRINSQVVLPTAMSVVQKDDRMWQALREHLPRSALWKMLDRWEHLQHQRSQLQEDAIARMQREVESVAPIQFATTGNTVGLNPEGTAKLVTYRLGKVAKASGEPPEPDPILVEEANDELVRIVCAAYICATVPRKKESEFKAFIHGLQVDINSWPETESMRRVLLELTRVTEALLEELATILLRRVVPGRCKYCPF